MSIQEESTSLTPFVRSPSQELVNAATHGVGLVLSVVGAVVLLACALFQDDVWRVVGCGLYAATLVAVYTASTMSHAALDSQRRHLFRTLDQGFIYLLIVGTYTPFALAFLRTGWWPLFLGLMWAVALTGFVRKVFFAHRVEAVSVAGYILLGWMPIFSCAALMDQAPMIALWWMLIGGLCYTAGTVFLVVDKRAYHFHAIWHLFVVAGSAWHFFAILFFVARMA